MLPTEDIVQDGWTVYWYKLNSSGVSPMPCCVNHLDLCVHLLSYDCNKQRRKKSMFWMDENKTPNNIYRIIPVYS